MNNGTPILHDAFHNLRNIIFDLGGVLYNVDYALVEKEFAALQPPQRRKNTPAVAYSRQTQPDIISRYEIGAVSTAEFCEGLRSELGLEGNDETITAAWNAMLLGVYPGRNALVWRLKQRFNLSLLSNTNEAHIAYVKPECQELFSLFDKLFFSFEVGLRKPQTEIFRHTLEVMGYAASETLFIDDSYQHIEAARRCGIKTLWLQNPESLALAVDLLAPKQEAQASSENSSQHDEA
jgi:putative hydrolase of the HAD superfamily